MMITKTIDTTLPTIGILIFEEFLTNEVVAPMDVFTKKDIGGKQLFNVILIAKEDKIYISEEDLKVLPDFTINNTPELNVLIVPSSNHPDKQINDTVLINFIKEHGKTADYIASHCAGAFMLGEAGVADNKKIVTYETGSAALQKQYPKLLVMDDEIVSVVQDGNMITSNGGLVSYIASLDLLEQMTNNTQRKYVEEQLLINKLKQ
ncbi:MAG: DJ-1/PfpI family protein [Fimbriimonadaceae bacterium]|nr:DJ-1/PfpI family protein [Chitinophagales bacterium]